MDKETKITLTVAPIFIVGILIACGVIKIAANPDANLIAGLLVIIIAYLVEVVKRQRNA